MNEFLCPSSEGHRLSKVLSSRCRLFSGQSSNGGRGLRERADRDHLNHAGTRAFRDRRVRVNDKVCPTLPSPVRGGGTVCRLVYSPGLLCRKLGFMAHSAELRKISEQLAREAAKGDAKGVSGPLKALRKAAEQVGRSLFRFLVGISCDGILR